MSNTEFVMVPRELAETFDRSNSPPPAWAVEKLRDILDAPTDKRQGEPVAWFRDGDEGREYCEKPFTTDWAPLYTHADPAEVERLRAEVERLRSGFYQQVTDDDLKKIADFIGDGDLPAKSFFLRPDAANLANVTMHMVREVQAARAQLAERDAQLLACRNELLDIRQSCEFSHKRDARIDAVLSAIAEPIAASQDSASAKLSVLTEAAKALIATVEVCRATREEQDDVHTHEKWAMDDLEKSLYASAEPIAPDEIDERAPIKPDAWRASINGNWEYFRSYKQALEELRQWQSDYLPEEIEEAKADGLYEPDPVYSRAVLERKP